MKSRTYQVACLILSLLSLGTSNAIALTINGREVGETSIRSFSVKEYCAPTASRDDVTPFSPSDPNFVIADYEVVRDQVWARSGRSITETPPNFDFSSYSEYLNEFSELIDASGQNGEQEYKARYEREKRELQQTISRLRASHGSIIVDWHCEGDGFFGGRGKVDLEIEVTLMYVPSPDEISVYLAESSATQQSLGATTADQLPESYLQSPVLDPDFYLLTYGDLRAAYGQQNPDGARQHWTLHGLSEARRSSPAFDVGYYRDSHPDLAEIFSEDYYGLVDHWLRHGIQEGRRSSLIFDVKYYLDKYPDLQQAFGKENYPEALAHWLNSGIPEGRQGSPDFDPQFYLLNNVDVADVYGAENYSGAIAHYLEFGRSEGRSGTP